MKLGRFKKDSTIFHGKIVGDLVFEIKGSLFEDCQVTDKVHAFKDLELLAPIEPPNIVCIGLNYKSHAAESSMALPERPAIFIKLTTSAIGPDTDVKIPEAAPNEVDYEAELCAVIGKTAKDIDEEDALSYVFGYTCGNDVSARDCQLKFDQQWARGKSFDGFCPLGPWIETDVDPTKLSIAGLLNGEVVQESTTASMIFSVAKIISYCSKNFTLLPGTVIMTGTPEGVGFARKPPLFLKDGDVFEVRIGEIGSLFNRFVK
jgi:2-keto-4-pentenoate hydratase/2-oxohepta-3-ene-1,7-dioic acid hydratase in catechol pathway